MKQLLNLAIYFHTALLLPGCFIDGAVTLPRKQADLPIVASTEVLAQKWQLTATTDPALSQISDSTYLIFEFSSDYTGKINKVLNSLMYDTPISEFEFNVDTDQNLITLNYLDL